MAKKQQSNKIAPKKYHVIKMACENCGEEVYYILTCNHCGGDLVYQESLELSQSEIKRLIEEEDADFKGNVDQLKSADDDVEDDIEGVSSIGALEEEELDDLYSKGPFSAL
jgi:hypothetical protein